MNFRHNQRKAIFETPLYKGMTFLAPTYSFWGLGNVNFSSLRGSDVFSGCFSMSIRKQFTDSVSCVHTGKIRRKYCLFLKKIGIFLEMTFFSKK